MHEDHDRVHPRQLGEADRGLEIRGDATPFMRPPAHELVEVAGSMLNDLLKAGFTPGEAERIGVYLATQATNLRGGRN